MEIIIKFLPAFGILGLLFVFIKNNWVTKQEVGNEKMATIAKNISSGAMSFLKAEYRILSIFVFCLAILESVKKTNRLVILEESWPFGNIATEITFQVQSQIFDCLDAPIEKINTADTPAPYSPVLLAEWLPNANDVIKSVKKVMYLS